MPRRGEFGDTTQRCAYCGKDKTSYFWSNRYARYCSFSCYAADWYMCNGAFLCCLLPISLMMYIATLNMIGTDTIGFNDPASVILLSIIIWVLTAIVAYTKYVGYSSSKGTDIEELLAKLPEYDKEG